MDSKGGANSNNGKSGDRPRRRPPRAADHRGKRDAPVPELPSAPAQKDHAVAAAATPGGCSSPCGACKFLRRKCTSECVFAPHFGSEQGPARFAAVHKVFGASNASKLLASVPAGWRSDAVVTVCYEAQARIADPVYGCVSTILALQQQVATLQAELSLVQSQLVNSRLAIANALRGSQQQQQQQLNVTVLQPEDYSNNSSASTNMINMNSFPSSLDIGDTDEPATSMGVEPFQLSQPSQNEEEEI